MFYFVVSDDCSCTCQCMLFIYKFVKTQIYHPTFDRPFASKSHGKKFHHYGHNGSRLDIQYFFRKKNF